MVLTRLGEEVSRTPEGIRSRFPGQPWRIIIDMRTMAARQDDALTARLVWKTLVDDTPALRDYVAQEMIPSLLREATDELDGPARRGPGRQSRRT